MRRHLNFTVEQWDALPWWQADHYWAGLEAEFGQASGHPPAPEQAPGPRYIQGDNTDRAIQQWGVRVTNAEGVG